MGDALKASILREKAVKYIQRFIGLPYVWGGDDPVAGFDCSGLVVEVLQAVGILPHRSDYSAAGLYKLLERNAVARGGAGCLVFWYTADRSEAIMHVEMMVDDLHTVGASGGGSKTLTLADAIRENAFVKMRPVGYRGWNHLFVDPFKVEE